MTPVRPNMPPFAFAGRIAKAGASVVVADPRDVGATDQDCVQIARWILVCRGSIEGIPIVIQHGRFSAIQHLNEHIHPEDRRISRFLRYDRVVARPVVYQLKRHRLSRAPGCQ